MTTRSFTGEEYRIVLIEAVDAPEQLAGNNWYRYIIDQGKNRICGYRRGSEQGITESIEELVVRLNERRIGPKGRVSLFAHPKGPAAAK